MKWYYFVLRYLCFLLLRKYGLWETERCVSVLFSRTGATEVGFRYRDYTVLPTIGL